MQVFSGIFLQIVTIVIVGMHRGGPGLGRGDSNSSLAMKWLVLSGLRETRVLDWEEVLSRRFADSRAWRPPGRFACILGWPRRRDGDEIIVAWVETLPANRQSGRLCAGRGEMPTSFSDLAPADGARWHCGGRPTRRQSTSQLSVIGHRVEITAAGDSRRIRRCATTNRGLAEGFIGSDPVRPANHRRRGDAKHRELD